MDNEPLMLELKSTWRVWRNFTRKVTVECGIPDSYRPILIHLYRHGRSNQKDIAFHNHQTTAAVSLSVKDMLRDEMIEKKADEQDQRFKYLELSEKGLEAAKRLQDKIREADARISEALTAEEIATLNSLLEKIKVTIGAQL